MIARQFSLLICLFTLSLIPALAQDTITDQVVPSKYKITRPNIIKLNSLSLPLSNLSITYERGIKPRLSAQIGVNYKVGGRSPKLLSVNDATIEVGRNQITGVAISPEVRYYLRGCDYTKLDGFYVGGYFRYTRYTTALDFAYNPSPAVSDEFRADLRLQEYGLGIQLGYQMLIKDRFAIDFMFFGPRYSFYNFGYEFDSAPPQTFLDDLSGYINDVLDRLGSDYETEIKPKGETSASNSFSFVNMRFGLGIGYAF